MVVRAEQKSARIAPRKLRLVADLVRGKDLSRINDILSTLNKNAAGVVNEVIRQAVANAVNNMGLPEEGLKLKAIMINEGMSYRRFKAGARGMAKPRLKRTSHIIVEIESPAEAGVKKSGPGAASKQSKQAAANQQSDDTTASIPAASSIAPAAVSRSTQPQADQKQTATKANKAGARVQSARKAGEK